MDSRPPSSQGVAVGSLEPKSARVLCSIGGEILWNIHKGCYIYSGGDTRIWTLERDISFRELMAKLSAYYHTVSFVKYQLPDLDLDTLVSVSGDEDVDMMMDEYELAEGRGRRLRLFLFPVDEGNWWWERKRGAGSRDVSPRGMISRPVSPLEALLTPRSGSSASPHLLSSKSLSDLHVGHHLSTTRHTLSPPRNHSGRPPPSKSPISSPRHVDWRRSHGLSPPKVKSIRVTPRRCSNSSPEILADWTMLNALPPQKFEDRSATTSPGLIDWNLSPRPANGHSGSAALSPRPPRIHTGRM
ncbi:hypothetical protein KFL_000870070 [Klebsormidium nitens]|uniref:PB1 domain-containing protein n=1 Tax=Klebsormidium nitens TaxID=105231 RepID=A0A1Y1HV33_KLENI|nr:hypothetical protein KFL_000870070 [Klebsormidium nitens]|eukprot:GAQ81672.1 hypothetical protein KFL_000870070 [Klebsormidium nitens]